MEGIEVLFASKFLNISRGRGYVYIPLHSTGRWKAISGII
jgi:hypothetical protein